MKKIFSSAFCAILIIWQGISVSAQSANIYEIIPEPQRESLGIRLNVYLAANYNKQWEEVFDLLVPHFKSITAEERKQGILVIENAKFFKSKRFDRVNKFTPQQVQKLGENFFAIVGCASFKKAGQREGDMWAFYENDIWYFTPITAVGRYYSKEPIRCNH